jgi:hypothetical protein
MKNILFSLAFAVATASHAYAETTIVNTGSDSGGFKAVLSMISEQIDNDFIEAGNPVVAASYFDRSNVITMWSTEWPGNPEIPTVEISEDTIVALQVYETILCSREFSSMEEMTGQNIKIATWGDSPAVSKFVDNLADKVGATMTIVPYDGSGSTTRGYLGGDADTIFTIQTRQSKVETDGTCFAFSADGDLDFAFVDVILSVNADAEAVSQYRNVVSALSTTEAWQTSFEGTETYVVNEDNASAILSKTNAAVVLNSN